MDDRCLFPPGEAVRPAGDGTRFVDGTAPGGEFEKRTGHVLERVEKCGILFLRAARVEDAGNRVSRKRRGPAGHEPRRSPSDASPRKLGKRRDRVPEDERFGEGDLERAQAATEAALAAKEVVGTGACRRLIPLDIRSADALS